MWFTDLASEPRFTSEGVLEDGLTSACALPVRYRGECLGAIKMMSRVRRHPDPDLIELVAAISGPLGAILHALEQSAERDEVVLQLEATQRHLELLLRANQVISEAKGYAQALDRLAEVAVPALADLCLIDVVQDDGNILRLAARHSDPTKTSLVAELARYAPDMGSHHPSAQVMATGRSSWLHHMSEEFLRMTSRDEHHLRVIKELGFTSYMTVPLMIGDRVKGTVTLVSAGSGRRFTGDDLTGAERWPARSPESSSDRASSTGNARCRIPCNGASFPTGFPSFLASPWPPVTSPAPKTRRWVVTGTTPSLSASIGWH